MSNLDRIDPFLVEGAENKAAYAKAAYANAARSEFENLLHIKGEQTALAVALMKHYIKNSRKGWRVLDPEGKTKPRALKAEVKRRIQGAWLRSGQEAYHDLSNADPDEIPAILQRIRTSLKKSRKSYRDLDPDSKKSSWRIRREMKQAVKDAPRRFAYKKFDALLEAESEQASEIFFQIQKTLQKGDLPEARKRLQEAHIRSARKACADITAAETLEEISALERRIFHCLGLSGHDESALDSTRQKTQGEANAAVKQDLKNSRVRLVNQIIEKIPHADPFQVSTLMDTIEKTMALSGMSYRDLDPTGQKTSGEVTHDIRHSVLPVAQKLYVDLFKNKDKLDPSQLHTGIVQLKNLLVISGEKTESLDPTGQKTGDQIKEELKALIDERHAACRKTPWIVRGAGSVMRAPFQLASFGASSLLAGFGYSSRKAENVPQKEPKKTASAPPRANI